MERNPYAPPSADGVLLTQRNAAPKKRSLLPLWLAALYCCITGACYLYVLVSVIYRLWDADLGGLLAWGFAIGILHPVARFAAGISLIRRARIAPNLCVALIIVTAAGSFLWQLYTRLQGRPSSYSVPNILLGVAEVLLLLVITRYAFALRSHGILRSTRPPRAEANGTVI
jgi:hypothetical protein